MVLIDSVARLLPGTLGNENSAIDESVYSGLLEHDQYTKPRNMKGWRCRRCCSAEIMKLIRLWKFKKFP